MKTSFLTQAACTLFAAGLIIAASVAQTPQSAPAATPNAQPPAGAPPKRTYDAPKNLQVLPKNLTGEQVHEIMELWEGSLGAHCSTCHAPDPKNIGPNGRPRLNFADDSKPEKETARKMYLMTEGINLNTISKIDNSGAAVTCGTCHRGHLGPEPYVIPKEDDHDHPAPPPPAAK